MDDGAFFWKQKTAPVARNGLLDYFFTGFFIAFMHLVQIFTLFPSILFDCKFGCCFLFVAMFEWLRETAFSEPLPHFEHIAIFVRKLYNK
jgi:hypothetical protein